MPKTLLDVEEACDLPGGDKVELLKKVRPVAAKLCDEFTRVVLKLHPQLAPIKVAVFPLVKKEGQPEKAMEIYRDFKRAGIAAAYDQQAAIGRRYRRMDEIGTPFCLTVDNQTMTDDTVTIRDRDTLMQERVPMRGVVEEIRKRMAT